MRSTPRCEQVIDDEFCLVHSHTEMNEFGKGSNVSFVDGIDLIDAVDIVDGSGVSFCQRGQFGQQSQFDRTRISYPEWVSICLSYSISVAVFESYIPLRSRRSSNSKRFGFADALSPMTTAKRLRSSTTQKVDSRTK